MEILEEVSNIIKNKFSSELNSKKYLKAEKKTYTHTHTHTHTHTKGGFQCLYAPIILIDSI